MQEAGRDMNFGRVFSGIINFGRVSAIGTNGIKLGAR